MNRNHRTFLVQAAFIFLVLLLLAYPALATDDKQSRASLRGLKGVYVSVEKIESAVEKDGLTTDGIREDVAAKLRRAGIKTLSKMEWFDMAGSPYLYVNANVLKLSTTKEYIYSIQIAFRQSVYPVREPIEISGASTWSIGGVIGINYKLAKIRASIMGGVDQFIEAFLSVNPK